MNARAAEALAATGIMIAVAAKGVAGDALGPGLARP